MVSDHSTFLLKRRKFLRVECSARAPKIGPFNSLSSLGFELRTPPRHISCEAPGSLPPVTGHLMAWLGCPSQACLERQQVERQAKGCSPGPSKIPRELIPRPACGPVTLMSCVRRNEMKTGFVWAVVSRDEVTGCLRVTHQGLTQQ